MLRLKLRPSGQVLAAIPQFDRFLEPYNLKVVDKRTDPENGTLELLISARFFGEIKLVSQFANNFFGAGILDISNESSI
jgi:hypothetical protein